MMYEKRNRRCIRDKITSLQTEATPEGLKEEMMSVVGTSLLDGGSRYLVVYDV